MLSSMRALCSVISISLGKDEPIHSKFVPYYYDPDVCAPGGSPKLVLRRISSKYTYITLPETLMLEVMAFGPFESIEWTRNGFEAGPPEITLSDSGEVLVENITTAQSFGRYEVSVNPEENYRAPPPLSFFVLPPGSQIA